MLNNFGLQDQKVQTKDKFNGNNIILQALLLWKMVLQYEFGQIIFKWFMIIGSVSYRICHFYGKITKKWLLATQLSQWLQIILRHMISNFSA